MSQPTQKKIWEQITAKTWCKGDMQDERGAFCALGWIRNRYAVRSFDYVERFRRAIDPTGAAGIANWNDAPERTFRQVKAAFRKADL